MDDLSYRERAAAFINGPVDPVLDPLEDRLFTSRGVTEAIWNLSVYCVCAAPIALWFCLSGLLELVVVLGYAALILVGVIYAIWWLTTWCRALKSQ